MSLLKIRRCVQASLLLSMLVAVQTAAAGDAKIYVIRETDGSIRFTNKPPVAGEQAEVFTARSGGGTYYRTITAEREDDEDTVYRARASLRVSGSPSSHRGGPQGALGRYVNVIHQAARQHRVNPALVKAVIHAESAFNPFAVSPKGARGLMQLMPGTARMLGVRNAFSPESNIHGGTRYLAQLLRRFGDETLAVAAYNAGEVPVNRYNGIPPYSETQEYVRRVLQLKKQYTLRPHG